MKFVLSDRAINELHEAYWWYEKQQPGLGETFLKTVDHYIESIQKNPHAFKTTYKSFKEVWIKKFPYLIVYFIDEPKNSLVVISVFHTSKNPKAKFRKK